MTDLQMQATWDQILSNLRQSLSDKVCTRWLNPLKPIKFTDDVLELIAPNDFTKNEINRRYIPFIEDSCAEITQTQPQIIINIENTANIKDETYEEELKKQQIEQIKQNKQPKKRNRNKKKAENLNIEQPNLIEANQNYGEAPAPIPITPGDNSTLNPKYTFDTFVIGESNSFAHAAALAIAEDPGKNYNPFFMYGGVGLGKTHLMHAIGHKVLQKNPSKRVLYISSEKFIIEFINSLRDGKQEAFRQKYRNIDVLLVDDVQFLAKKERIQEEFFHTFNTLKDANKQIILCSDRPPKEIEKLQDRLCSRFEGGLLADVQAPDLETRIAILKKKVLLDNLNVPDDVMTYIASNIDSNIRELEGALTLVVARASFLHYPITKDLAVKLLNNSFTKTEPIVEKSINIERIQEVVCRYFKLTLAELNGKKRSRNIAYPRQIAMYLSRELTSASLPKIGGNFGGRDHTTVMHAHDKIKKQCLNDANTASLIEKISQQINEI